jgi:hypothetical protein
VRSITAANTDVKYNHFSRGVMINVKKFSLKENKYLLPYKQSAGLKDVYIRFFTSRDI